MYRWSQYTKLPGKLIGIIHKRNGKLNRRHSVVEHKKSPLIKHKRACIDIQLRTNVN